MDGLLRELKRAAHLLAEMSVNAKHPSHPHWCCIYHEDDDFCLTENRNLSIDMPSGE